MGKNRRNLLKLLILASIIIDCSNFIRDSRERNLINKRNKIVAKLEKYKKEQNKIPNSLNQIGIKKTEEGPLYYQKIDSTSYIISFGTSLGESTTYYSNQKQWKKSTEFITI